MREIKFRLIRDGKIVGYEKWYLGSWSEEEQMYRAKPCWLYSKDNKKWNPTYIFHDNKEQFTGLKDKNGKEIFEGNIVHFLDPESPSRPKVHKSIVQWFQEGCSYECAIINSNKSCGLYKLAQNQIEVIGNIHDKPD